LVGEAGVMRSGLIAAGGFGDKIRRVMFAQLSRHVKSGVLSQQEVARAVAELNTFLYRVLVEELKLEKSDPVRIEINYVVRDGGVVWDYSSLRIEAFKPIPQNIIELAIQYAKTVTKAATTSEESYKGISLEQ